MRIAVYGSGGREHALVSAFVSHGHEVIAFPGNPGIAGVAAISPGPFEDIDADLFVIGPEAPLVDGLADVLRGQGKLVVGPGKDGAQLEGSKAWMKEILKSAKIPTASFRTFTEPAKAIEHLNSYDGPYVVKTDGLAAGKGVLVTRNREEAIQDVIEKLNGHAFGSAGTTVVIEEAMEGPELSLLVLCDGTKGVALSPAQDFKRIYDGDQGPNTGGMGAFSPVPNVGKELVDQILSESVDPLIKEFNKRGIDYRGVLYAGLMLTKDGPKIVEFNIRFGDPETQVVIPRVKNDLAQLLFELASGDLKTEPEFISESMVTVVIAAEGYPLSPRVGAVITGAEDVMGDGVQVFHAGTRRSSSGDLVVGGGRVLNVTAKGKDLKSARGLAYESVSLVSFEKMQYRRDIALNASELSGF
ncbi:MAG: phosphoribosylamine--glycine ligase [Actinomycetota bacterium]|nr:phosphoribosylamine--glycine ligase [Actinomycetota bacterium]